MFEKVNPSHPDKLADRIAGAIVDLGYKKNKRPKVAVEVLVGHGECNIIIESTETFTNKEVDEIVKRIAGNVKLNLLAEKQDEHLTRNQEGEYRCGDNGIFKGVPLTDEEKELSEI
ncbi:MAG TPA: S-adenosylmethionine synthetase N-terminal domain-containing protein, partial [Tissierellaceae bacterium]|nr:S-adenosylmethionine synthetase N-terminal domain-containing protein [Tissierellaceae bacterium]